MKQVQSGIDTLKTCATKRKWKKMYWDETKVGQEFNRHTYASVKKQAERQLRTMGIGYDRQKKKPGIYPPLEKKIYFLIESLL